MPSLRTIKERLAAGYTSGYSPDANPYTEDDLHWLVAELEQYYSVVRTAQAIAKMSELPDDVKLVAINGALFVVRPPPADASDCL